MSEQNNPNPTDSGDMPSFVVNEPIEGPQEVAQTAPT